MADNIERLKKVVEVAFGAAAADGLEREEAMIFANKLMAIAVAGETIEEFLRNEGVEEEDIDFIEIVNAASTLDLAALELIELSDSYLEEASAIIGEGTAINNLCLALCIVLCAGDGEISATESEAVAKVASSLPNIIPPLSTAIASAIINAEIPSALD